MSDTVNSNSPTQPNAPAGAPGPLVSVVIPYYMQQDFIAKTVLSAKAQTYPFVEVIVVDDGSPVPAGPALAGIEGVQLFRTENHGCPSTRNYGFSMSQGEYLLFLDGDDLLRPDAVEAHLYAFKANPDAGLSFGAVSIIDKEGRQTQPPHVCRPRRDYFLMLLESNPIWSPGATLIRREAFEQAGRFNHGLNVQVDDYDLYLRLARLRPFARHSQWVLEYRLHGNNVSKDQEKMLSGTLGVLDGLERSGKLTPAQANRLRYGRQRWLHVFRPRKTLRYRIATLLYAMRSALAVGWAMIVPPAKTR